jgi:hypothetical protein
MAAMPTLAEITLFNIVGIGVPPYSARGISEVLEPIQGSGQMFRDINGTLHNLGVTQFRKFQLSVTCTDMDSPALNGVWPGDTFTVHCQTEMSYPEGSTPVRTPVTGSERIGQRAEIDGGGPDGFRYYRPQLTMMVMSYQIGTADGWEDVGVNWQLQLQEV